jgi:phenylpropionate dioxygenase-like ring-hydroxylating dioxygenase large terminal subunit
LENGMTETVDHIQETTPDPLNDLSQPYVIPVEAYYSREYAQAEKERLWSKVWLNVARESELPKIGDFLTYSIADDEFIVIRTGEDTFKAYSNVCSHRGRPLVDVEPGEHDARGRRRQFVCPFHGWRYDTEGACTWVAEAEDWGPQGPDLASYHLPVVTVDTWGGWIWLTMNPDAEPLRQYLEPMASLLEPFQLQNMRVRWRRWLEFDCNWKVALEAFMETYHLPQTHPEFRVFGSFLGWSRAQGTHSHIGYDSPKGMEENQAKVRIAQGTKDPRQSTADMQNFTWNAVETNTTKTLVDAANRLMDELPEGTPPDVVLKHWLNAARRDDEARGVIWPEVSPEATAASGTAWQVFPNFQIGHGLNNALCYSARPLGDDPNKCIFEAAVYEIYPEGEDPQAPWINTPVDDEYWVTHIVLPQDFSNMGAIQKGMKRHGFAGSKPNPYRERGIVNFHRNLARYMGTGAPTPL